MKTQTKQQILSAISDQINALILWTLSDGRAYTATELADYAETTPEDMKSHVKTLMQADLILPENHRHHYLRLADDEVAEAAKSALYPGRKGKNRRYSNNDELPDLKYCRSCHGHLAGKVGVKFTEQMQQEGMLIRQRKGDKYEFILTENGESFFSNLNVATNALRKKGGIFAKACLDFSERKHHLGGKLGVAMLDRMIEKDWIRRRADSRVHDLTDERKQCLNENLGLTF